jgi:hypothetical protein
MQPPLSARLELEMLHGIDDEDHAAINTGLRNSSIEHSAGGTNERASREVLLIARPLAHHHQPCADRPFSRYYLSRIAIERAALAGGLGLVERTWRVYGGTVHRRKMTSRPFGFRAGA